MVFAFSWPAYVLPVIFGAFILAKYRQDKLCKAGALFALKPILATPLWAILASRLDGWGYFATLLPGVLLTAALGWVFKGTLRANPVSGALLLVFDAARWLFTFIIFAPWWNFVASFPGENTWLWIALLLPNAYAGFVLGLALIRNRRRRQMDALLDG